MKRSKKYWLRKNPHAPKPEHPPIVHWDGYEGILLKPKLEWSDQRDQIDWRNEFLDFLMRIREMENKEPDGTSLSATPNLFYKNHPLETLNGKVLCGHYSFVGMPGKPKGFSRDPDVKIYTSAKPKEYYSVSTRADWTHEKMDEDKLRLLVRSILEAGYDKLDNPTDYLIICSTKDNSWTERKKTLKAAMDYAEQMRKYNKCQIAIHESDGAPQEKKKDPFLEAVKAAKQAKRISGQHKQLPVLAQILSAKLHAFLVGPAGSGKSSAAEQVAKQMNLSFTAQSVCAQTSKSELLGYMDANGRYVASLFRKAYEQGGIFLLDEVDAGNANVLAVLNSALSNDFCSFPDAMVTRHKDFLLVAAANTFGNGADRQYVGRNQLDAATLDRFVFLEWEYDKDFELELAKNESWTEYVQRVRKVVGELKIRHVISPRASIGGAKLLEVGMPRDQVEKSVLWKGLDQDSLKAVKAKLL